LSGCIIIIVDRLCRFLYNIRGDKMKKLAILTIFLTPIIAQAQTAPDLKNKSYVGNNPISFFDPSKLTMRHSYSFAFYSGGGHSGNIGMYMNSIEYAFADPLKIRIDLGFLHTPSQLFSGSSSIADKGVIVPGISLDWRPSKHFNLRLDYRQHAETYRWYGGDDYERFNLMEENR